MSNEKAVKRKIKLLLDKHGWFWWMTPANGFGTSGVSDFCAIKDGVFLVIEAKSGTNRPTALQKRFAEAILASKGYAFAVNEQNINSLDTFLTSFDDAVTAVSTQGEVPHAAGAAALDAMASLMELW